VPDDPFDPYENLVPALIAAALFTGLLTIAALLILAATV